MENNFNSQRSMYLVRGLGERNKYALKHRQNQNIVAIGWPESDVTKYLNSLADYEKNIQNISNSKGIFGKACTDYENFTQKLKIDDIVLIPDDDHVHICCVTSDSFFNLKEKDGYPIVRKCKFVTTELRSVFSTALQEELKNCKLTVNISQYWGEIRKLI